MDFLILTWFIQKIDKGINKIELKNSFSSLGNG